MTLVKFLLKEALMKLHLTARQTRDLEDVLNDLSGVYLSIDIEKKTKRLRKLIKKKPKKD